MGDTLAIDRQPVGEAGEAGWTMPDARRQHLDSVDLHGMARLDLDQLDLEPAPSRRRARKTRLHDPLEPGPEAFRPDNSQRGGAFGEELRVQHEVRDAAENNCRGSG